MFGSSDAPRKEIILILLVIFVALIFVFPPSAATTNLVLAVAWPTVAIFGIWYFRSPLTTVIQSFATRPFKAAGMLDAGAAAQPSTPAESTSLDQAIPADPSSPPPNTAGAEARRPLASYFAEPYRDLITDIESRLDTAIQTMQQSGETETDILKHATVDFAAALHVEKASRHIFGSQLDAIGFVSGVGGHATKQQLKTFYDQATNQYPEFYQNYSLDRWLEFMINWNLIDVAGDVVTLKPAGKSILPYMQAQGYLVSRPVG